MSRKRTTFVERLRLPPDPVIQTPPPGMIRLYRIEQFVTRRGPWVHGPLGTDPSAIEQRDVDGNLLASAWKDPARVVAAINDRDAIALDLHEHRLRVFEVFPEDIMPAPREHGVLLFPRHHRRFRPIKSFSVYGGRRAIERELTELAPGAAARVSEAA